MQNYLNRFTRSYFYHINIHGQLFLVDTVPKNLTTCYKDKKFLNFFYTRLRVNNTGWYINNNSSSSDNGNNNNELPPIEQDLSKVNEFLPYKWISPCGKEMNFVSSEDVPIVFHDFTADKKALVYGGDLQVPFKPDRLVVSKGNGRVYYRMDGDDESGAGVGNSSSNTPEWPQLGLLKSSFILDRVFSEGMEYCHEGVFVWEGRRYPMSVNNNSSNIYININSNSV